MLNLKTRQMKPSPSRQFLKLKVKYLVQETYKCNSFLLPKRIIKLVMTFLMKKISTKVMK